MKYSTLTIGGKKHVLAFTGRAAEKIEEKCGDISQLKSTASSKTVGQSITSTMWLLATLMEAGYKYAQKNGIECDEPITYDMLMDDYGLDDMRMFESAIAEAMRAGQQTTVEVEAPKNADEAKIRLG